jgi:hypothetical protein
MSFHDRDQTPIDNVAGYIQCMSTAAIAAAVRGEIDVVELLRAELAARGMNVAGQWVGFERAKQALTRSPGATPA